jgi:hypothetical protein
MAFLAAALLSAVLGCGPDSRMVYAEETARLSATAITEIQTSGGEDPQLSPALDRAHVRLGEIEHSIDLWRDHGGPMSYRVHAPCLRSALQQLRSILESEHRPVPQELDTAEAMLGEVADHACPP